MGDFGTMENDRFIVKVPDSNEYASISPTEYENEPVQKLHTNGVTRLYPLSSRLSNSPPRPPKAHKQTRLPLPQQNGNGKEGVGVIPSAPPAYNTNSTRYNLPRRVSQRFQRAYSVIEPQPALLWLFGVCLVQLLFAHLCLFSAVTLVVRTDQFPQHQIYAGCWVSALHIITGITGIVAAKKGQQNFYTAALILGVLSFVGCIILFVFSMLNWLQAGRGHPLPHCVLHEFLAARISHIYQHESDFDFAQCLESFKIGVAMNAIIGMFALFQGLLFLVTIIMICTRLCTCTGYPCPTVRRVSS